MNFGNSDGLSCVRDIRRNHDIEGFITIHYKECDKGQLRQTLKTLFKELCDTTRSKSTVMSHPTESITLLSVYIHTCAHIHNLIQLSVTPDRDS